MGDRGGRHAFSLGSAAVFWSRQLRADVGDAKPDGDGSAACLPHHGQRRFFRRCCGGGAVNPARELDYRIVLGLALGAIPAVLVAALIVKEMPMTMLRWLVVVVVSYAGGTLLLSATRRMAVAPPDIVQTAVLD